MNKTKIDWCDYSWNPVTGCLHGCSYCYARKIANRFGGNLLEWSKYVNKNGIHALDMPVCDENSKRIIPYPYRFEPTFHKYRLDEPSKKTKGVNIFVCSMADLFGEWVPDEWIKAVFEACEKAPQHRYLFLTKNPKRYAELAEKGLLIDSPNFWYGSTATNSRMARFVRPKHDTTKYNTFISIEPLLEKWDMNPYGDFNSSQWIIVGAETGNRKGKVIPKKEWIMNIKNQCRSSGVPIFMKESLRELMGQDFIQEYPW